MSLAGRMAHSGLRVYLVALIAGVVAVVATSTSLPPAVSMPGLALGVHAMILDAQSHAAAERGHA